MNFELLEWLWVLLGVPLGWIYTRLSTLEARFEKHYDKDDIQTLLKPILERLDETKDVQAEIALTLTDVRLSLVRTEEALRHAKET